MQMREGYSRGSDWADRMEVFDDWWYRGNCGIVRLVYEMMRIIAYLCFVDCSSVSAHWCLVCLNRRDDNRKVIEVCSDVTHCRPSDFKLRNLVKWTISNRMNRIFVR